jgi:hypothetical protein
MLMRAAARLEPSSPAAEKTSKPEDTNEVSPLPGGRASARWVAAEMIRTPDRLPDRLKLVLLAAVVFACPACDWGHDYNSPDPSTLDYHTHLAVLHFRTTNHAADTLGVTAVTILDGYLLARRDASSRLSRGWAVPGRFDEPAQLVYPDSQVHSDTVLIEHYVGYQLRYGGDTSRLSSLDDCGDWTLNMRVLQAEAALAGGETLDVEAGLGPLLPDSVTGDGLLELDVTVDLDGLLEWREARGRFALMVDHIHVRRRVSLDAATRH